MSKKILYIAKDTSAVLLTISLLRYGGHHHLVDNATDLSSAEHALANNKYDNIVIEPNGVYPANSEPDINKAYKLKEEPEFYGKKILTDIIRAENSLNKTTITNIILDMPRVSNHPYSEEVYLKSGANRVIYKPSDDIILSLPEFIESQIN